VFGDLGARIAAVTREAVAAVARTVLVPSNRTIGWFDPEPVS
jgi:predicted Zn-dependent peptidase